MTDAGRRAAPGNDRDAEIAEPDAAGRPAVVLVSTVVALVGLTLLPWGEIGGVPQRGNGVAEHLLAVPDLKGTPVLPVARVLGISWYTATVALLGAVAIEVFDPSRRRWLRGALVVATVSSVLLACAMYLDQSRRLTLGSCVTVLAAAVATGFAWRSGRSG